MLLKYRDVSRLTGPWYLLELLSEGTLEVTLRRLCQAIPGIFQKSSVLIFVPMDYRDGMRLQTGSYLYLHSDNFSALARLKRVRGVVGLVTAGGVSNPRAAIRVECEDVESMISQAQREHSDRIAGIRVGCSVRVLDGLLKNYCGDVVSTRADRAVVLIKTETRVLRLETARGNLLLQERTGDPFRNAGRPKNPPGQK
jgi:hypothetical protein